MNSPEFDSALVEASEQVHDLARRTRTFVLDALPRDVVETVQGRDIGYGWTPGYQGLICVISIYRRWVNLGLPHSVGLPDPAGLLQGTGKGHRHVRISSAADLEQSALRDLLLTSLIANPRPNAS